MHEWMINAYPEHKALETFVRLQRVEGYLWMSIDITIDPEIGPGVIYGLTSRRAHCETEASDFDEFAAPVANIALL